MCSNKKADIFFIVLGVAIFGTLLGIFIWWLVELRYEYSVIELDGEGFGDVAHHAAFTRITRTGDLFWVFYPSLAAAPASRPLLLWLGGVTGLPPSLAANFAMFGPYDFDLERRNDSWVDSYNLLFVDAPIGTGFSTARRDYLIPTDLEKNTDHLLMVLESFYSLHEDYENAPLYIFGQGDGAQMALSLALKLNNMSVDGSSRKKGVGGGGGSFRPRLGSSVFRRRRNSGSSFQPVFTHNLQGVVLVSGIVAPSQVLTKLGFYLEEMGYIDANGRAAVESFSTQSNSLLANGELAEAFDHFLTLGDFINEEAGAVAVNLGHLVQKLSRDSETTDYFGKKQYLQEALNLDLDLDDFMVNAVAPALGMSIRSYDASRQAAVDARRETFMAPMVNSVENILQNTQLSVAIINGNLDALSTTPGQLDWVNSLNWSGRQNFTESSRETLIINRLVEGYFREYDRLAFYWMNAAGEAVPLDSPIAMRRVLQRIVDGS